MKSCVMIEAEVEVDHPTEVSKSELAEGVLQAAMAWLTPIHGWRANVVEVRAGGQSAMYTRTPAITATPLEHVQ